MVELKPLSVGLHFSAVDESTGKMDTAGTLTHQAGSQFLMFLHENIQAMRYRAKAPTSEILAKRVAAPNTEDRHHSPPKVSPIIPALIEGWGRVAKFLCH